MGEVIVGRFGQGSKKDEAKERVSELLGEAEPAEKQAKKPRAKRSLTQSIEGEANFQAAESKGHVDQSIVGNKNTQIAGNIGNLTVRTAKAPKMIITPAPGTIGADLLLRGRVEKLLKEVNQKRYERLGDKFKFGALYGDLARAFGLKPKEWKAVWLWPESRAGELIRWLEEKLYNTQQGRIEKVARREGYRHTRGHLFRIEQDCLDRLDLDADSETVKEWLKLKTGKESRSDLDDNEFRNWVAYLEGEVARAHGETTD